MIADSVVAEEHARSGEHLHAPRPPRVSIGMPVYNGEAYIRQAIDSLCNQSFSEFEIIISDNASSDGTEAICRAYAARDHRVKYIRQDTNLGVLPNFKLVLEEARAEYFMWAASDDSQESEFLRSLVAVLDEHQDILCAMSDVLNIQSAPSAFEFVSNLDDIRLESVLVNWKKCRGRFFRNPTSNIFFCIYGLFRRKYISQVDLNFKGMHRYAFSSEVPILAQLALLGPICSIAEPLKIYRRHSESAYHNEHKSLSRFNRIGGFLSVSRTLFVIVRESRLSFLEKVGLSFQILISGLGWFIEGVMRAVSRR